MNSQGEKQQAQQPRQEQSDADDNVSFAERRFLSHALVFSKHGRAESEEGVEGNPY